MQNRNKTTTTTTMIITIMITDERLKNRKETYRIASDDVGARRRARRHVAHAYITPHQPAT